MDFKRLDPCSEPTQSLLREALRLRASDLHADPDDLGLEIRVRSDGRLYRFIQT